MSKEKPDDEDQFTTWLAACDDALARGTPPPDLPPRNTDRGRDDLACVRLLREVLGELPSLEADFGGEPDGRTRDGGSAANAAGSHGSAAGSAECPAANATGKPSDAVRWPGELPWKNLGRFDLQRELGRGGCGVVYLAHDPLLARDVALKVPHAEVAFSAPLRDRFQREARAASNLDHPNIVPVYEVGQVGPVQFIVSAYCPGVTLAEWLKNRREPVFFQDAAALIAVLADAVAHAHARGVVHRDLKPANILLAPNSKSEIRNPKSENSALKPLGRPEGQSSDFGFQISNYVPKITDFGLAKLVEPSDEAPTRSGVILGTASYMAPEQAGGKMHAIGPSADIYALGAILYELLTGRPPFRGESDLDTVLHVQLDEPVSPSRLRPRTPRDLQTICLKCLRKESERRYASASSLAADLRRYLDGQPIHARPTGRVERMTRWCRRNPALATACGFAAGAVAAVIVLSLNLAYQQSKAAGDLQVRERETRSALNALQEQSVSTQRQMALRTFDQGLTECEAGHVRKGMLTLARSLSLAAQLPADTGRDMEHAIRMNLAAWRDELPEVSGLYSHDAPVKAVAYRPDGMELATASVDGVTRRWKVATHESNGPEWVYPGDLWCLAYAPDGKTIAVGGDKGVRLFCAADGQLLHVLERIGTVYALTFSRDGKFLFTGGSDKVLRLWHAASGEQSRAITSPSPIRAVALTRDGSVALAGCEDGSVRFWDGATGKPLPRENEIKHKNTVYALAVNPEGTQLATGSGDESAAVWDLASGTKIHRLLHQGAVFAVAFHPNRSILSTAASWQTYFWETKTYRRIGEPLPHASQANAVAFHPGGDVILTGSSHGTARSWKMVAGRDRGRLLQHDWGVQAVAFNFDGRLALTAGLDGLPRIWDGTTGALVHELQGPAMPIHSAALSPDGRLAAAGGDHQDVWIWDVASGRLLHRLSRHEAPPVRVVTFSPKDESLLASVDDRGLVILWDARKGEKLRELDHRGRIDSTAAVFSPDGRLFLTGGAAGTGELAHKGAARLWDVATGRPLREFPLETFVDSVAFSPDGQWIATGGGRPGAARLWNAATGAPVGSDLKHEGWVRSVDFSADSRRLLTAGFDHTARVWSVPEGLRLAPPVSHDGRIRIAAFSPDASLFATGSFDHTARIWDTATARPVGPAFGFGYWVVSVAFRPDGRAVLLGSSDHTARLCDVAPPVSGDPERVSLWAEVLTGAELENEVLRVLDAGNWRERQRRLEALGSE
jgi:WD40 repeat protein/serine/threonine protein kinase